MLTLLLAFSCNPKQPSITTATHGAALGYSPAAGVGATTPSASSSQGFLEAFLADASTCERAFGDNTALKYVSPQAVARIRGEIKINGYCYDQWNVSSSTEVYSPAAGTLYTVAISNEDSFCHRLTILVVEEAGGYALYPGEYSPDSSYLDPWQTVDTWVDGSPDCPNYTGGGGVVGVGGLGTTSTVSATSPRAFMESFVVENNCDGPPLNRVSSTHLDDRAVNRSDLKINNFCYDEWRILSESRTSEGTEFKVTIGNPGSYCHKLTYVVLEQGGGYAMVPGIWHDSTQYIDPWIAEDRNIEGTTGECPWEGTGGGGLLATIGTSGGGGATAPNPQMGRYMEEFMDLNNCNGPTPMTSYISEKGLISRGIPTTGQKVNNFCYDAWNIVSYSETPSGTEVVATIGGDSYCHELTYKLKPEAGGYRFEPGLWHNDVSYVDPWVSERRNITDSTCPGGGSGGLGTLGGLGGSTGIYASSPRDFMDRFMDLNNCDGPGLDYMSTPAMNSRSIPTSGIQINNFCYETWTIVSESATGEGTRFVATIGNDSYCHKLTYTVVEDGGLYSLVPGTYHSGTGYVDPWVAEQREVTDSTCQNQGGGGGGLGIGTPAPKGTPDAFMEDFISVNNCDDPTPLTSYVSETGLISRGIPTYGEQINNFCYDGWNIHSRSEYPGKTVYKATIGNVDGFCHELTYEVVPEGGGYRMVPGTWHSDVNYVDPWIDERRDILDSTCPKSSGANNTYSSGVTGGVIGGVLGGTGGGGPSYANEDAFMTSFISENNCNAPEPTASYVSRKGMTAKSIPYTEKINNFCYDAWNVHSKEKKGKKTVYKAMIAQSGSWCNELTYEVVSEDGGYRMMPGTHHASVNYVDPWVDETRSITDPRCPTSPGAHNTFSGGGGTGAITPTGGGHGDPDAFMAEWKVAGNGCGLVDPPTTFLSPSGLSSMGLSPSGVQVNNFCYDDWRQTGSRKVSAGTEYTIVIGTTGSWCHRLTYVVTNDGLKPGEYHSDTNYIDPWVTAEQWIEDPACP